MSERSEAPRLSTRRRILTALAASVAVVASTLTAPLSASAATPPDGLTSQTAAASCWEIKQSTPSAPNGVYWLVTPALVAPQQFYCDQTTDGGGWVLIGRGREGWKPQYTGLRSAVTLRNVTEGTGAFATAQLPARTVDALLNNGRVDALAEGVRIRRATNTAGTAWQEVRFRYQSRDRWVWAFGAEHRVASYSFDGLNGSGGQTNSFGADNGLRRVDTNASSAQGYVGGLAYGANVAGSTSASSYLWSKTEGAGNARPFAQMFVRPRLTTPGVSYPTIADAGAPAIERSALPESDAIPTVWGVSGFGNGKSGELNTEVQAFAQIGDTVYVGGNFRYVQRSENATGADKIEQRFLAAFDVNTGQWKPGFRPVLNNQVKALTALPDGRLAVGGMFTTANGAAQVGMAVLDPTTGANSGWQLGLEHRLTGGVAAVRGFSVEGNWLYVSGAFTHFLRNGQAISSWNGGRINATTGVPDASWNPLLNGTSVGVEASKSGDRTYFSGYFRQTGEVFTPSGTAIQTVSGAPVVQPQWTPQFSKTNAETTGNIWQLGVAETNGRVWLGGSEHSLFAYDRGTFQRQAGYITKAGGDFQAVEATDKLVFAGCHCGDWVYSNAYNWDGIGTSWTQGDKMNLFGAWDAASGAYIPDFNPIVQARAGYGAWALFQDSTGALWAGGDFSRSVRAGEVNQWSGGFIRFRARDTSAPTTPSAPAIVKDGAGAVLTWNASSDDRGVTGYEVLRNDRVIGTTTARTFTVTEAIAADRFFVRAIDAGGNRSATTAKLALPAPQPEPDPDPVAEALIASGSAWQWRYDSAPLPADWTAPGFDASSWATGDAVLGFGSAAVATDISVGAPAPRPLSAQFRRTVEVSGAAQLSGATVTVRADDGVVVYVNGQEIGRRNLPAGTLTQNSYATAAPTYGAATAAPAVFEVPPGLLVDGQNVVAVSTHLNYRSSPSVSFDLALSAQRG